MPSSVERAVVCGALLSCSCVTLVRDNPATARHFERCVTRENGLDARSGWRDRPDAEIDRLCVAEARARKGLPVEGVHRSREQKELDRLWSLYESCSDFMPYQDRAEISRCEAEVSANIDAAKARHALRREARADREQRERHHEDMMGAMRAAVPGVAASGASPAAPGPPTSEITSDRASRATAIGRVSPPWWCFEGTIGSAPTGWCAQTPEACGTEARSFATTEQAKVTRGCEAQPLAACVRATKVLQSTRQVDCFATFAGCEALRAHMLSSSDYTDVTTCDGTPTSWVGPKAAVSPF